MLAAKHLALLGPKPLTCLVTVSYNSWYRILGQTPRRLVHWTYELPSGHHAHRPTALDAAGISYWRPGGRTKPLYAGKKGLPEAVNNAVTGRQLRAPIRPCSD